MLCMLGHLLKLYTRFGVLRGHGLAELAKKAQAAVSEPARAPCCSAALLLGVGAGGSVWLQCWYAALPNATLAIRPAPPCPALPCPALPCPRTAQSVPLPWVPAALPPAGGGAGAAAGPLLHPGGQHRRPGPVRALPAQWEGRANLSFRGLAFHSGSAGRVQRVAACARLFLSCSIGALGALPNVGLPISWCLVA